MLSTVSAILCLLVFAPAALPEENGETPGTVASSATTVQPGSPAVMTHPSTRPPVTPAPITPVIPPAEAPGPTPAPAPAIPTPSNAAESAAEAKPAFKECWLSKKWPGRVCLREVSRSMRAARCTTALCWGSDDNFALEPLIDLPIGGIMAPGSHGKESGLDGYINNNAFTASVTAGVRVWVLWDIVSFSVYFSKLIPTDPNAAIRLPGSDYEYSPSQIRRKYPGFALGLLNDIIFIGFDHNQLRNRSGPDRDPAYLANAVVEKGWTISIGFAPITLIRNTIGGAKGITKGKKT